MKRNGISRFRTGAVLVATVALMGILSGCSEFPKQPSGWKQPSVSLSGFDIADSRYARQEGWHQDAASQLEVYLNKCGWFRIYQATNDVDYYINGSINKLGRTVAVETRPSYVQDGTNWVWITNRVTVTTLHCNVGLRYVEPSSKALLATGEKLYSKKEEHPFDPRQRIASGEFPVSDTEYQQILPLALRQSLSDLLSQLKVQYDRQAKEMLKEKDSSPQKL